MSIIRKVQRTSYTVVDNKALQDVRLSWKATGLLAYLLSLPDGWRINNTDLTRRKRDGKDATIAGLRELEQAGYIERRREHDEAGHIRTVTLVYEEPVGSTMELADSPGPGLPGPVEPGSGFMPPLVSTQPVTTHRASNQEPEDQEQPATPSRNTLADAILAPDSRAMYLRNRLIERDPARWIVLSPAALMKLGKQFDAATLIEGLSYVYEQDDTAFDGYPYLLTICRRISERVSA